MVRLIKALVYGIVASIVIWTLTEVLLPAIGLGKGARAIMTVTHPALNQLQPWNLAARYIEIFQEMLCPPSTGDLFYVNRGCCTYIDSIRCVVSFGIDSVLALIVMLYRVLTQSAANAFVDFMQLAAGFALTTALFRPLEIRGIPDRLSEKVRRVLGVSPTASSYSALESSFWAALWIVIFLTSTTLLSIPMLFTMEKVAEVASETISPEPAQFATYTGWVTGLLSYSLHHTGQTEVHHAVTRAVKRLAEKWFK